MHHFPDPPRRCFQQQERLGCGMRMSASELVKNSLSLTFPGRAAAGARRQAPAVPQPANGSGSRRPSGEQRSAPACQRSSSNRGKPKRQVASCPCCCQRETALASDTPLLHGGDGKAPGNAVHLPSPQPGQHPRAAGAFFPPHHHPAEPPARAPSPL